jgi:hypothetical protein
VVKNWLIGVFFNNVMIVVIKGVISVVLKDTTGGSLRRDDGIRVLPIRGRRSIDTGDNRLDGLLGGQHGLDNSSLLDTFD